MRPTRLSVILASAILCSGATAVAQPIFTGNVNVDFAGLTVEFIRDPGAIDVGVPIQFDPETVSGNDIARVFFYFDDFGEPADSTMYVGVDTYRPFGDVDGDGDPGFTTSTLAGLSGADRERLGGAESFALLLDIDQDGIFDAIIGVPLGGDLDDFYVSEFVGSPLEPASGFGDPIPGVDVEINLGPGEDSSLAAPDLEFAVTNYAAIPLSSDSDSNPRANVLVFLGSFEDAGIGEDFVPGAGSTEQICVSGDADGNGIADLCDREVCDGRDNDRDGRVDEGFDSDGDGIGNCLDSECPPLSPANDGFDNDGDGLIDEDGDCGEVVCERDCGEVVCERDCGATPDSDGDCWPNFVITGAKLLSCDVCPADARYGDPTIPVPDSDGDGVNDCRDLCPDDRNKFTPGVCGCGILDRDTDRDGVPDCDDVCPLDRNIQTPSTDWNGDGQLDSGDCECEAEPGLCICPDGGPLPDRDWNGDGNTDVLDCACDRDPTLCDFCPDGREPDPICGCVRDELCCEDGPLGDRACCPEDPGCCPDGGASDSVCGCVREPDCCEDGPIGDRACCPEDPGCCPDGEERDPICGCDDGVCCPDGPLGPRACCPGSAGCCPDGQPLDSVCGCSRDELCCADGPIGDRACCPEDPGCCPDGGPSDSVCGCVREPDCCVDGPLGERACCPEDPGCCPDGTEEDPICGCAPEGECCEDGPLGDRACCPGDPGCCPDGTPDDPVCGCVTNDLCCADGPLGDRACCPEDPGCCPDGGPSDSVCGCVREPDCCEDGPIGDRACCPEDPGCCPDGSTEDPVCGCVDDVCCPDGPLDGRECCPGSAGCCPDGTEEDPVCGCDLEDCCPDGPLGDRECCPGSEGCCVDGTFPDADENGDGTIDELDCCTEEPIEWTLDFETDPSGAPIVPGQDLAEVYAAYGIHISVWDSATARVAGRTIAFGSDAPTGDDVDLGTPNELYGGPGVGAGGESNQFAHLNVAIKAANVTDANGDGLVDDPNDDDLGAYWRIFFDEPVCVDSVDLLDIDTDETPADIYLFDAELNLLGIPVTPVRSLGDNSVQTVDLGGVCNVSKIVIDLWGSGAWDNLVIVHDGPVCPEPPPECEYLITFDTDPDGNPIEPGENMYDAYDGWGVRILAWDDEEQTQVSLPITFDTDEPTGGDDHLATDGQGNVLVSADDFRDWDGDGRVDTPSDNPDGGHFDVWWTRPVCVGSFDLIATDGEAEWAVYDRFLRLLSSGTVEGLDPGEVFTVEVNTCDVHKLVIDLSGEGGVDNICFSEVEDEEAP